MATVGPHVITDYFTTTGTVESPQDANVASKITGRINYLQVHEGDPVKKGQLLVGFDPSNELAEVKAAGASLTEAQNRLAQAQLTKLPNDVNVDTQIREMRAAVTSAKADYDQFVRNYTSQVHQATQDVKDAQTKVDTASATITSAQANLQYAKNVYERDYALYKQGFVAPQNVESDRTQVTVMQSTLSSATEQLTSSRAQLQEAREQLNITTTTGQSNIADADSKLVQAKNALQYATSNLTQKPAYERNLAALQNAVAVAQESLKSARATLAETTLYSPLDGFVTSRMLDPGNVVVPGQSILTVQFVHSVWVDIAVPPDVIRQLHLGQSSSITFDELPGKKFSGRIVQLNRAADLQSRQFDVRMVLANVSDELKPGTFANVSVITNQESSRTAVPLEGLQKDDSGSFAMVLGPGNVVKRRSVVPGLSDPSYVAIESGLEPGERVIVSTYTALTSGQKVQFDETQNEGKH
jgi:RND family efflux transporter MFP subunit